MAEKQVQVKVATDVDLSKVQALEDEVNRLRQEKLRVEIEANMEKLNEIQSKIEGIDAVIETSVDLDDEELEQLKSEMAQLESERIDLEIAVEKGKLDQARAEVEELDGKQINIDVQTSMQNLSQGISQTKQGVSQLASNMNDVSQAGMQMEQNMAFLTMNMGAEKAKKTMQDISDIVASMPGDDNTMRSVLSTAQALGANLNPDEMRAATATMADYMQGSATMGKMAVESQQDIMKYLLDGNTAELERGSIVSSQVDKLKQATTFQERQAAMQEVLNSLGYGGIAQQDTMINKQAEWEGMIYNSKSALSSMWLGAEKGAMDYILKLNDATGGILGMGIVAGQMAAGPLVDIMGGLGQIAVGARGLKDAASWFKELEFVQKAYAFFTKGTLIPTQIAEGIAGNFSIGWMLVAVAVGIALGAAFIYLYNNCDWFREGVNNLAATLQWLAGVIWDSVGGAIKWLSDTFSAFTNEIGLNTDDWVQAVLGFILFLPQLPMRVGQLLVDTIARALGFGDNFTQTMIDSATNAVNGFLEQIYALPGTIMTVLQGIWDYVLTLGGLLPQQTQLTGNQIVNSILQVLGFISQLPAAIAMYFVNIIASTLGFGNNFTQNMINAGVNAVNGFVNWITSLPGKLKAELDKMLDMASNFAMEIADKLTFGGASMVAGWLSGSGEHSPGFMYDALIQELLAMLNAPEMLSELVTGVADKGYEMANALSMALFGVDIDTAIMSWITTLQGFQDYMLSLGGLLPLNVELTGNQIIDTLLRVVGFFGTLPLQIGMFLTDMIAQAFGFQGSFTDALINAGLNGVNGFISFVTNLPGRLWAILLQTLQGVYNFGSNFISGLASRAMAAVSGFANAVQGIPRAIQQCLDWAYNIFMSHPIVQAAIWLGNAIANGLSAVGLGQKSPGKIVKAIRQELKWSQEEMESSDLPKVSEVLGANIASNFNPNLGTSNVLIAGSGRSHGDTIINVYGDVDSDNRVKQLVEAVRLELEFDNKTAGRTV